MLTLMLVISSLLASPLFEREIKNLFLQVLGHPLKTILD